MNSGLAVLIKGRFTTKSTKGTKFSKNFFYDRDAVEKSLGLRFLFRKIVLQKIIGLARFIKLQVHHEGHEGHEN